MSRKSSVRSSIFDEMSQVVNHIDPKTIRPLYDRVVVEDVPEDDSRRGSLWIPETCRDQTMIRRGRVVACGLGDKYTEHGIDKRTRQVSREPIQCKQCGGSGVSIKVQSGRPALVELYPCIPCKGTGLARFPMTVKPGDLVLYNRRRDAELYVNGTRYSLIHEEQSVYAILKGDDIIPIQDRLLVKREQRITNKHGVLFIPDTAIEKNQEGVVMAIGLGKCKADGKRYPVDVKVGERVLFGKLAGSDIKINGKEYMIMSEKEVLAVLG